jgi:hypothetical protein
VGAGLIKKEAQEQDGTWFIKINENFLQKGEKPKTPNRVGDLIKPKFSLLNYKGTIAMNFEKLNAEMFEQISQEEMEGVQGGVNGISLTCLTTTGPCGCLDAGDTDPSAN